MATRDEVCALLDRGLSYEAAARELGIPAGQAYMVATGRPADGRPAPPEATGETTSPQRLVGPVPHNPESNPAVLAWVRERAARELSRPS